MAWVRAVIALVVAAAVALILVSGGSATDPRTPPALPGLPAPFLGTAVAGSGGLTAAVDAYGDVVDLRAPGPAGRALIDNPSDRQAAGSVGANTGVVPRVRLGGGPWLPPWRADAVSQRYLPGTNVVETVARFERARVVTAVAAGAALAVSGRVKGASGPAALRFAVEPGLRDDCAEERRGGAATLVCGGGSARSIAGQAAATDRRWLARARPLGSGSPPWARRLYRRSLLTLRALTDRRTGAVAAGVRDGWAYVWPRDAATAALAFAAAGYAGQACRVAGFLSRLDLGTAARFHGNRTPVPGRGPQGDAAGWVAVAVRVAKRRTGYECPRLDLGARPGPLPWRDLPDYREGAPGDYLANAIAATALDGPKSPFPAADGTKSPTGTVKSARRHRVVDFSARRLEGAGVDAAEGWAVRPFGLPWLYAAARRTLLRLAASQTRFGITPGLDWPGADPWTAPTAWTAWAFAALADAERDLPGRARADRRAALRLLADLRRAATPAGDLPERVGARTGTPRSTTPLAWSHAFAILALGELWPAG